MNIPPIEIRVGELKEIQEESKRWMDRGPHGRSVMFLNPKGVQSIFSEQRLRLIRAIRGHPGFGTVKLAQFLGRKQEAISRDVSFLKEFGVIIDSPQIMVAAVRNQPSINTKAPKGTPFFLSIIL
ncbi:MAG: hypothetical protein V1708_06425 [Candidatus Micrarchaeota archaeon]